MKAATMNIVTHANGATAEFPPSGGIREMVLGDTLTIQLMGQRLESVAIIGGDPATQPTVELTESRPVTASVTFSAPGRYDLRIVGSDGTPAALQVVACEPEALAALPDHVLTGHGSCNAQSILRSLAMHAPWFTGRRTDLFNQSLTPFGG